LKKSIKWWSRMRNKRKEWLRKSLRDTKESSHSTLGSRRRMRSVKRGDKRKKNNYWLNADRCFDHWIKLNLMIIKNGTRISYTNSSLSEITQKKNRLRELLRKISRWTISGKGRRMVLWKRSWCRKDEKRENRNKKLKKWKCIASMSKSIFFQKHTNQNLFKNRILEMIRVWVIVRWGGIGTIKEWLMEQLYKHNLNLKV